MRHFHLVPLFVSMCVMSYVLSGCSSASLISANSPGTPAAAPLVVAVGDQANGVAPNRWQYVQFSEPMDAATINDRTLAVTDTSGKAVSGTVAYFADFDVAGFQPNPALQPGASYAATVTTGVASAHSVHMAKPYSYTFATRASADKSPVYVASVAPAANATCVSATAPITITFSEGVDLSTLNSNNIVITGPGNAPISAQINYDVAMTVATLTPRLPLPSGNITVTVKNVADAAGVAMTSIYGWQFQTTCGSGRGTGAEFLYVLDATTQQFYAYRIDPATGNLSAVAGMPFQVYTGATHSGCQCIEYPVADPLGRFLFYSFQSLPSYGIGSMNVDPATGALVDNDVLLTNTLASQGLSMDPQGRSIFGIVPSLNSTSQSDWLQSVVVSSVGQLSFAPGSPYPFDGGEVTHGAPAASNEFVFVSNDASQSNLFGFSIDQTTSALAPMSATQDGANTVAQVITPSGKFLYTEGQGSIVSSSGPSGAAIRGYQVNADGSLTPISQGPLQTPDQIGSPLTMSPNGNLLYVSGNPISGQGTDIRVYAIDQNTGSLSLTADYSNYGNTNGIGVIDHETRYAYFVGESSPDPTGPTVCTLEGSAVNPTTGALKPLPGPGTPLPVCSFSMAIVRPQ